MRSICLFLTFFAGDAAADVFADATKASFELLIDNHLGGSGMVVDPSGIGLTAAHIVMGNHRLEARSKGFGRQDIQVLAIDAGHDIALIQLPVRTGGYPALSLAPEPPSPGDTISLFGAPIYRHGVMLRGAVARAEPAFEYLPDMGYYIRVIHVSGPAPPGTSGGAWLNTAGQVIGVQSGLMHDGGAPVGIAYMAPHGAVERLVTLKKTRPTTTVGIGFEEFWEQPAKYVHRYPLRQEGLVAAKVDTSGPGYAAGVRTDDLVIRADGRTMIYRDDLLTRMRAKQPGDAISLVVRAVDGTERTIKIILGDLGKRNYSRQYRERAPSKSGDAKKRLIQ